MNHTNLIPLRRIELKRKRSSIGRWTTLNVGYVGILVIVGFVYFQSQSMSADRADLETVRSDLAKSNSALDSLRKFSSGLRGQLESSELSSKCPDWSILLAVLSNSLGNEVVLTRVDCSDDPSNSAPQPVSFSSAPQRLRITGIGRSQRSVTQFVLRVESLNVFPRVRLLNTAIQSIGTHNATSFDVVCDLPRAGRS